MNEPQTIEETLVCRDCGYSLYTLTGNRIRCPECGTISTAEQLRVGPKKITKSLIHLESQIVESVGSFLFIVTLLVWQPPFPFSIALFVMLTIWCWQCYRCGAQSEWSEGWIKLLMLFHGIGLLGTVLIFGILVACIMLFSHCTYKPLPRLELGLLAAGTILATAILFTAIPIMNRKAKQLQSKVQERSAIRLAQGGKLS